jgi:hypothetical protein
MRILTTEDFEDAVMNYRITDRAFVHEAALRAERDAALRVIEKLRVDAISCTERSDGTPCDVCKHVSSSIGVYMEAEGLK